MYLIANVLGSPEDEEFNQPREYSLPGGSWIGYYRRVLNERNTAYLCTVHNCNNIGSHGGHVRVYQLIQGNYYYRICGIVPLCQSHNSQRCNMRSGLGDRLVLDGRTIFSAVRIKNCRLVLLNLGYTVLI